jgi:hypothetical protein
MRGSEGSYSCKHVPFVWSHSDTWWRRGGHGKEGGIVRWSGRSIGWSLCSERRKRSRLPARFRLVRSVIVSSQQMLPSSVSFLALHRALQQGRILQAYTDRYENLNRRKSHYATAPNNASMPRGPTGRGCVACRAQKKKVSFCLPSDIKKLRAGHIV